VEPLNRDVLEYLEAERVAPEETTTAWVIDGYSLATHPDLCDPLNEVNAAAGEPATSGYRYRKPVLIAENGVIVAFAGERTSSACGFTETRSIRSSSVVGAKRSRSTRCYAENKRSSMPSSPKSGRGSIPGRSTCRRTKGSRGRGTRGGVGARMSF